jgi:hypothetical protein
MSSSRKRKSSRILKSLPASSKKKTKICQVDDIRLISPDKKECFVHWSNTLESQNSWIPITDILDQQLIRDYEEQKQWKFQFWSSNEDKWKDMASEVQQTLDKQFQEWVKGDLSKPKLLNFKTYGKQTFEYGLLISRFIPWEQENLTVAPNTRRPVRRVPDNDTYTAS